MDKQQEQTKQNPNQEVEYVSVFLDENEVANESEFEEPTGDQEAGKSEDSQQNMLDGEEQPKKVKRPRKTLEQEIAELDAKRERLMEKKRRQDAHEKIVFGASMISMLKYLKINNVKDFELICNNIVRFSEFENSKNKETIKKIICFINM